MPALRRAYDPGPLNHEIILKTVKTPVRNALGQIIAEAGSKVKVWAGRYDRRTASQSEGGDAQIEERYTTYTIRKRAGVTAATIVMDDGLEYTLIGPPRRRGGIGSGRAAGYLELDCILRV